MIPETKPTIPGEGTLQSGHWFFAVDGHVVLGEVKADCAECAWQVLKVEYPGARLGCWTGNEDGQGCIRQRKPDVAWMKEQRASFDKAIKREEATQ